MSRAVRVSHRRARVMRPIVEEREVTEKIGHRCRNCKTTSEVVLQFLPHSPRPAPERACARILHQRRRGSRPGDRARRPRRGGGRRHDACRHSGRRPRVRRVARLPGARRRARCACSDPGPRRPAVRRHRPRRARSRARARPAAAGVVRRGRRVRRPRRRRRADRRLSAHGRRPRRGRRPADDRRDVASCGRRRMDPRARSGAGARRRHAGRRPGVRLDGGPPDPRARAAATAAGRGQPRRPQPPVAGAPPVIRPHRCDQERRARRDRSRRLAGRVGCRRSPVRPRRDRASRSRQPPAGRRHCHGDPDRRSRRALRRRSAPVAGRGHVSRDRHLGRQRRGADRARIRRDAAAAPIAAPGITGRGRIRHGVRLRGGRGGVGDARSDGGLSLPRQ